MILGCIIWGFIGNNKCGGKKGSKKGKVIGEANETKKCAFAS